MRVLVVEDERELADAIVLGLRREGYAVDPAYDGLDGYVKARVHPYDVGVCLDALAAALDALAHDPYRRQAMGEAGRKRCGAVHADPDGRAAYRPVPAGAGGPGPLWRGIGHAGRGPAWYRCAPGTAIFAVCVRSYGSGPHRRTADPVSDVARCGPPGLEEDGWNR